MARKTVLKANMISKGGTWLNLSIQNRLLPPKGVKLVLGRFIGKFMGKCCKATSTLIQNEDTKHQKNKALHWSPWGPFLEGLGLDSHWTEIARQINNKGFATLASVWNHQHGGWQSLERLKLSLQEEVLMVDYQISYPKSFSHFASRAEWKVWK